MALLSRSFLAVAVIAICCSGGLARSLTQATDEPESDASPSPIADTSPPPSPSPDTPSPPPAAASPPPAAGSPPAKSPPPAASPPPATGPPSDNSTNSTSPSMPAKPSLPADSPVPAPTRASMVNITVNNITNNIVNNIVYNVISQTTNNVVNANYQTSTINYNQVTNVYAPTIQNNPTIINVNKLSEYSVQQALANLYYGWNSNPQQFAYDLYVYGAWVGKQTSAGSGCD